MGKKKKWFQLGASRFLGFTYNEDPLVRDYSSMVFVMVLVCFLVYSVVFVMVFAWFSWFLAA